MCVKGRRLGRPRDSNELALIITKLWQALGLQEGAGASFEHQDCAGPGDGQGARWKD